MFVVDCGQRYYSTVCGTYIPRYFTDDCCIQVSSKNNKTKKTKDDAKTETEVPMADIDSATIPLADEKVIESCEGCGNDILSIAAITKTQQKTEVKSEQKKQESKPKEVKTQAKPSPRIIGSGSSSSASNSVWRQYGLVIS